MTARGLFRVPGVAMLLVSSFAGNFAQWGALFVGVQSLIASGAPVLAVQSTAIASFAPLLFAGTAAGWLADRLDRLSALRALVVLLAAGMAAFSTATALGAPVGVVYGAALLCGLGQIGNHTLLRPMLYERAGPDHGTRALALDALGSSLAVCLGPLVMGYTMTAGGTPAGYAVITVLLLASRVVLGRVRVPPERPHGPAPEPPGPTRRTRRPPSGLAGILGVTVLVNLFYFPFQAVVPVIGERFTSEASQLGVLAAAPGIGMVAGNTVIALLRPRRLGRVYVAGAALCMIAMIMAVHAPLFGLTFVVLIVAGTGISGFSASQAALVLQAAPPGRRSRTMGILSTAIGTMPLGTLLMGITSTAFDTTTAVTISGAVGLAMLALCLPICRPILRSEPLDGTDAGPGPVPPRAEQPVCGDEPSTVSGAPPPRRRTPRPSGSGRRRAGPRSR